MCFILLCSDGVGRSGTFCALMFSMNQFKVEHKVDIFQIIKIIRTQRPGSVANAVSCIASCIPNNHGSLQDQFKFIHNALVATLKQYASYHNFTDETTF